MSPRALSSLQRPELPPGDGPRLLICASTRWEARPIARRLALRQKGPRLWEGLLRGGKVLLLRTGMGPAALQAALSAEEGRLQDLAWVVSAGFAGGLQPALKTGDLVADLRGLPLEILQAAQEIAAKQGRNLRFGKIAHADAPLSLPALKRALAQGSRAAAVDMETGPLRRWAEARGAGFLAVRVILDGVDQRLPENPPAEDAGPSALARWALGRWKDWPLLASLGARQALAARCLAGYLAEFLGRPEISRTGIPR